MKIPVFVVGCVLALASAVGLGLCMVGAWFLQHPLPDLRDYNPPRASTTAVGLLIILLVVLLLGAVANLLSASAPSAWAPTEGGDRHE